MPCVSIIVPVFNAEPYLPECLDSILGQTLRDIEIICVNDGSTDRSLAVLEAYRARDARVRVVNLPKGGVSVARNTGVALAAGDALMFVDADDWVEPDFCEVPYLLARETQSEVVSFQYLRSSEQWQRGSGLLWSSLPVADVSDLVSKTIAQMLLQISVTPVTKLWSRAFWLSRSLAFPTGLGMGEDQFVHWVGLLEAQRVVHIDRALYHYRTNENSATNNGGVHCMDIVDVYARIQSYLRQTARYDRCREPYLYAKLTMFRLCYLKVRPDFRDEFAHRILEALTADEWSVIQKTGFLPFHIRNFYFALKGHWAARALEKGVAVCRKAKTILQKLRGYQARAKPRV